MVHFSQTINNLFFLINFPSDCDQPTFVGDGYCNDETNILECSFDKGDCCGSCIITESCTNCSCIGYTREDEISNVLVGDGYCNDKTNTPNCNFDGGDCCGSCIITEFCSNCSCIGGIDGNEVLSAHVDALVGDGFCHDTMNNAGCSYDQGDCCLSNVTTDFCSDCKCHFEETCEAGFHPSVGDGYCNDITNNQQCNFDGGDCCGSCIITDYCTNCSCIGGSIGNAVLSAHVDALVGDGVCHDMLNNAGCNYDSGDCCHQHQLINNGFCNDETNIPGCFYDGGDCCVNMNTDYCSNCSCSGGGVIISPGYPGSYDDNLNISWIIQFPLRQFIEIDFISFDVEDHSSCK